MCEKVHRVVVSLTDAMHNIPGSIRESLLDSEISILDQNTMLIRLRSGANGYKTLPKYKQMKFDAVGYEDESHVRYELNELLVQMFSQHRHGCLLRLTPRRAHNVKLMTRLLVSDVDKILEKLPCNLEGINVEYHDLRKFDMINMLASHRGKDQQSRRDQRSRREMQTTREMFQWLHNEYSSLRGRGTGDDFLSVEFVLGYGFQKQRRLNLAIFNIFDCNERTDIGNFFQGLPTRRQCKSSLLTDCIKESFDRKRSIYTLVVCEMQLDKECAREMHKFLQLADMACLNVDVPSKKPELLVESTATPLALESQSTQSDNSTKSSDNKKVQSRNFSLSADDHSKLALWYQRIDNKFDEVKINMEMHYNVQYRQKYQKIVKRLSNLRTIQINCGGDASRMSLKSSVQDEAITARYIDVLKQFRQLEKEVKRSTFSCTLASYMSNKNYALVNAEKALQEQEIANLKEQRRRIKSGFC